jgi:hypothetical protein
MPERTTEQIDAEITMLIETWIDSMPIEKAIASLDDAKAALIKRAKERKVECRH